MYLSPSRVRDAYLFYFAILLLIVKRLLVLLHLLNLK